ncbi:MAG: CHAD domain-containing protein [Trichloromonas sp.]|jgi:CHAD domain-containing protein|nr:CHAD domain-containing protein [Trichloromonas sp.]
MEYLLPEKLSLLSLRDSLRGFAPFAEDPPREGCLRYFDSFDWRLFRQGLTLEEETTDGSSFLQLRRLGNGSVPGSVGGQAPDFAEDLPSGAFRDTLKTILENRRLFPLVEVRGLFRHCSLLDDQEKTVARLTILEQLVAAAEQSEGWRLPSRLRSAPVRGYDRELRKLDRFLQTGLGLEPAPEDLWHSIMLSVGRSPGDYSAKPDFRFDPAQPAGEAVRAILAQLLATLERNLDGTRRDLDSEFLHDFRVAIRRTRAALGQLKDLLPAMVVERFRPEFAWLGTITSPVRDLDVHLLGFDGYRNLLPPEPADDLAPLHERLLAHQRTAQRQLAEELASPRFRKVLADWRAWLAKPPFADGSWPQSAALPLAKAANAHIRRSFRRVLREGAVITDGSPPEEFHELRKSCKKLRYLLEFFQSLYPRDKISPLIRSLKELQENLGEFQDLEVHAQALRALAMMPEAPPSLPPETLLAIGQLSERLRERQRQVRAEFAARFGAFAAPGNLRPVRKLFRKEP